jgi:hypothetical protein
MSSPHDLIPMPHFVTSIVPTDQLTVGDYVLTHGRLFSLIDVQILPDDIEREVLRDRFGPCRPVYVFQTSLVATYGNAMPDSWANVWTIQGNWRALWERVDSLAH